MKRAGRLFECTFILFVLLTASSIRASAFTDTRENYEKTGRVIWEADTEKKLVALTFDDGPHPLFTPQILKILAAHHAKATFFVAGNKAERFPEVLKMTAAQGHEIGNHTFHHPYSRNITADHLTKELIQTDAIIERITGEKPILYRPVGGLHNDSIIHTAIRNHKTVVLWSWHQDPRDWQMPPASKISRHIIKGIQPGNIILFHDWIGSEFSKRSQTVAALEDILDYLDKKGYKCVTVSELLYRTSEELPKVLDPAAEK